MLDCKGVGHILKFDDMGQGGSNQTDAYLEEGGCMAHLDNLNVQYNSKYWFETQYCKMLNFLIFQWSMEYFNHQFIGNQTARLPDKEIYHNFIH